jgi:acetoacetyl-CoA reductase
MEKKLALVTGGTRGIGKAISIALKQSGYEVIATYASNNDAAHKFKKEYDIEVYQWNVADFDECEKHIVEIVDKYGRSPDILINNAGITRDKMMHKSTYEDWEKVITTNLSSCYNMCHAIITHMRNNKFGRIINISSINGQVGQLGQTNYSAAKAGMIGFSKALARENANKNITVNVVAPGYIETDMTANMDDKVLASIKSFIPVGRLGKPEDIARSVLFLAANEADFITGSVISVNGGQNM